MDMRTMTDRWDVPDERLARIASRPEEPRFRECPHCHHRHAKGETCGYQNAESACRCKR